MGSVFFRRLAGQLTALLLAAAPALRAEVLTVLHIGDQESWLLSAQGNRRDDPRHPLSFYGGVDRLATVVAQRKAVAAAAGSTVLTLNAGDAFLPGPRLAASFAMLASAHPDGGQDFYDTIAQRLIGVDATVFGNHEFDLDRTGPVAARFAEVSPGAYLSVNLDFQATPAFARLAASGKVAPSRVFTTTGGKRIGVVGATTPLLPTISSPPTGLMKHWSATGGGLQNLQAVVPLIQGEIDRLRREQGASVVLLLSHLQGARNEIQVVVPALRGVDLVISGGGHELMADADDALIPGGVAPTFASHPVTARDADGQAVPVVTSHFGNRYVGELRLEIDDASGRALGVLGSAMFRVSGAAGDADAVAGDPAVHAQVVQPVQAHVDALNAQVVGHTAVALDGPTHVPCAPAPCAFTPGVRNAETGLGNLVADALRFAARTDVAIQNGGGIRSSIAGPGPISVGDTFNVLPFTALVKRAPQLDAAQLKDLLEHGLAMASPRGDVSGRFPQVSGMQVVYDSTGPARQAVGDGRRIRRIVLDDGSLLVDDGKVVSTRTLSLATIDFLANGGDGYPFAANGVAVEDPVDTITYQEALLRFLRTPADQGGLRRSDGSGIAPIAAAPYGPQDPLDRQGRLIDLAVAPGP